MYIGIDNGGTSTRVAIFESLSSPRFDMAKKFATSGIYAQQIALIEQVLQDHNVRNCAGVAISIGAQVARDGQTIADAANLPDYVGKPIVADLTRRYGCPVRLAHDAVCGLLAEKAFGGLAAYERCAYMTLSTGTGVAIQLQKESNAMTFSIEMGHQILDQNPLECLCGQIGCLETITGGKQIELRCGRPAHQIVDQTFWSNYCDKLALGLVNLAMLTRVDAVTISGGIGLNNSEIRSTLQQKVDAIIRGATLDLSWATLGEDAPLIGASCLLKTSESQILH